VGVKPEPVEKRKAKEKKRKKKTPPGRRGRRSFFEGHEFSDERVVPKGPKVRGGKKKGGNALVI